MHIEYLYYLCHNQIGLAFLTSDEFQLLSSHKFEGTVSKVVFRTIVAHSGY